MSTLDDAALIKQCLEGDSRAFDELVDRYQKPLYNTALRMTGDSEEARDITQDAFIKAFERMREYRPEHKFFSWIYRILINDTLNHLKQRKHTLGLDTDTESHERLPDEEFDANRQSERIERALRILSFDQRIVIVMRYFNDMSYMEMSTILGLPEKTVKSRLYSARQNLAGLLTQTGAMPI
jgi:RNA polymerase sigma-70 factor (ECF subfamily)